MVAVSTQEYVLRVKEAVAVSTPEYVLGVKEAVGPPKFVLFRG